VAPASPFIVTIDGPSGTGKSTAARGLARRLGFLYLETGAMYRAVALAAGRQRLCLDDARSVAALARRLRFRFRPGPRGGNRLLVNGKDVTRAIRSPKVSEAASRIAAIPGVRRALVARQRQIGRQGRVVVEGRDAGTVVFPKARLKIFLSASPQERARRRFAQWTGEGRRTTLAQVEREERARDLRDSTRAASPLRVPRGAVRIDNSRLQSSEVLDTLLDYVRSVGKGGGSIAKR
jgi:cytidylate kinase